MIRKIIHFCLVIFIVSFMAGCISSGLKVTEVSRQDGKAALIGSINHSKGAQIITYVTEIDGNKIEVERGYYREYKYISYLEPGEHNIVVEARQGRNAIASFNIRVEADKTYVAQAKPLSIAEMQIWVTELNSSEPITNKETVLKGSDGSRLGIVNELMYHNEVCKKYPDNDTCK